MSERGELEVLLPLTRWPTRQEQAELRREAFTQARVLAATVNGKVLGIVKVARAQHPITDDLAMRVTFAVEAPDATFDRVKVHTTH